MSNSLNDAMFKAYTNQGAGTDSVFRWKAAAGLIEGFSQGVKFGNNADVDTSTEEDVWNVGGQLSWITVAQPINIVSDSAIDSDGQPGANAVLIQGLDADYNEIEELVLMNGTTTVTTTQDFFRVNECDVAFSGDTDVANVGTINLTASVDLTDQGQIDPVAGTLQNTQFTVPAGKVLLLEAFTVSTGSNDTVRVFFDVRNNVTNSPFLRQIQVFVNNGISNVAVPGPTAIQGKSDIRIRAQALSQNNQVDTFYQYGLIDIPGDI